MPALPQPPFQVQRQMVSKATDRISLHIFEEDGVRAFQGEAVPISTPGPVTTAKPSCIRQATLCVGSTFFF